MRNILIIGANGFTGRQLLKDLSVHKQLLLSAKTQKGINIPPEAL